MDFAERVVEGMKSRGMSLRELCREVELDPSFFSKVLSGKRSPPMEESVLRRVAAALSLDAAELVVSAGRIPAEWRRVADDSELFQRVHRIASGASASAAQPREAIPASKAQSPKVVPATVYSAPLRTMPVKKPGLSEELL